VSPWDGRVLALGPAVQRQVMPGFTAGLRPGEWVSLHYTGYHLSLDMHGA